MNLTYNYQCMLSILIENQPNILIRLIGLFARRGFTIEGLTLGSSEHKNLSRVMITFLGNAQLVDQLIRQLYKLFAVVKIDNLTTLPKIIRELELIKLFVNKKEREEVFKIINVFNLDIVDFTLNTLTIEIVGDPRKIISTEYLLNQFKIIERISTGKIGLLQESYITTKLCKTKEEIIRQKVFKNSAC